MVQIELQNVFQSIVFPLFLGAVFRADKYHIVRKTTLQSFAEHFEINRKNDLNLPLLQILEWFMFKEPFSDDKQDFRAFPGSLVFRVPMTTFGKNGSTRSKNSTLTFQGQRN